MKFPLGINTSFSLTTAHTKIFTSYLLEISINDLLANKDPFSTLISTKSTLPFANV